MKIAYNIKRMTARLAFILSEHADGLTPERLRRYEQTARRLEKLARAEVVTAHYAEIDRLGADAMVLSGSADPWSAHDPSALERFRESLHAYEGPVLGICAGMQVLATAAGAEVATAPQATGPSFETVEVLDDSDLLAGLENRIDVWEHHTDEVLAVPPGSRLLSRSETCGVESFAANGTPWWGTQFHPEEWNDDHPAGRAILENFLRLAEIPLR